MNADPRHILHIGLEDRPGAVHAVAEVFSGRGLQMEVFQGHAVASSPDGCAAALIVFRALPERADLLARVLGRLSMVRKVELLAEDDPRLFCLCMVSNDAMIPAPGITFLPLASGDGLACGTLAAMASWRSTTRILSPLRIEMR